LIKDGGVITTDYIYRICPLNTHVSQLFCHALFHVIYSIVSGQYSYTILVQRMRLRNFKYTYKRRKTKSPHNQWLLRSNLSTQTWVERISV